MVQLQFQCFIFKDVVPSEGVLEEFSKTHLTVAISKKTEEISLVEEMISKESSYKSDSIQYRPEEASLKVAQAHLAEVPSKKTATTKTQKHTEISPTRGTCDLDVVMKLYSHTVYNMRKKIY